MQSFWLIFRSTYCFIQIFIETLRKSLIFKLNTTDYHICIKANGMTIKTQLLTICLLLVATFPPLNAASIYIFHDATCMDRLVYARTTANGTPQQHIVYRIKASDVEDIFLEIGTEGQQIQEFMPPQVYGCGAVLFDESLVESVNNRRNLVFVVLRLPNNRYSINQVQQASYFQHIGQAMTYVSARYSFAFNTNRGVVGENIATGQSGRATIFFEGKLESDCSGAYIFRRIAPDEAQLHTDFVLIPEVGLQEERIGKDANDAINNTLRLEKVNDYTPTEYLRLLCKPEADKPKGGDAAPADKLTVKGLEEYDKTTGKVIATANPCGEASGNGFHIVQKGETLFRIAQTYQVTVPQIKTWNRLSSNIIRPCDKLRVAENMLAAKTPTPQAANQKPVVNVPAPYDQTMQAKGPGPVEKAAWERAWEKTAGYHVVSPGETAASIALKYGFSEARFRSINGLGPDEMVKIGQPLKTTDCLPTTGFAAAPPREPSPTGYDQTPGFTEKSAAFAPYNFNKDDRITPQFYMQSDIPEGMQTKGGTALSPELARRAGMINQVPAAYDQTVPVREYEAAGIQRATHTVKEGDTLFRIARMYGISPERLKMLNNLESDVIVPFQRLYIN